MKLSLKIAVLIFLAGAGLIVIQKINVREPIGLHYSLNGTQEFFEQAYQNISAEKPQEPIAAITVNHHLLAPNLVAQEFALVATDKPITIVLISPNHFYAGEGGVITSNFDWQTPYGVLESDRRLVSQLKETGLVNVDETPFEQEHGVSGIVGFIKRSLPNAKFVPIIVKENLSDEQSNQIANRLAQLLPQDTLLIGSFDFSHYLTSNAAQFHDTQTLAAIHNFDYDRLKLLDVDSHSGLRVMLKYLDSRGAKKFILTSHENSSTVTGNYSFAETTSYIDGYFTLGQNEYDATRTVLYVQGVGLSDQWKPETTERLYRFNDEVVTNKPAELSRLNLGKGPKAIGLVYNSGLTDVYLFPLEIINHEITLQVQLNPDTMHLQFK